VTSVALFASGSPATSRELDQSSALERYRPILRYDSSEDYFAQPVSLPPGNPEVRSGDRIYGHVARESGETWLQYWLFYAYNPQDRSPLRTGRHEGDWELIQFRLARDGRPTAAAMSQHSWAEGCAWAELEQGRDGAPILYVANGSHATYSAAGAHDRPFPDPTDEADGSGREARPEVTEITVRRPAWVGYPGRWGETEAGLIPGETSSPVGPRVQESGAWTHPGSYFEDFARPCGSGAPDRPWQTAAAITAGALLGLGAIVLIRRRRARR
jgi:MYXO-CTERM domain-containing protein